MKFYLDEDLSQTVAEIGRKLGLDVISSHECGRDGLEDEAQFEHAVGEGRCFVTCNTIHFLNLTMRYFESGLPHFGVLVVTPRLRIAGAARIASELAAHAEAHPAGVPAYFFDYLGN